MEKKVEASSSTNKSPVVYLHRKNCRSTDVWYRIDVESLRLHSVVDTNKPKTECSKCYAMTIRAHPEPMQLSPFALMTNEEQGGSWTVDGEDIYYVGGINYTEELYNGQNTRNLLKLNARNPSSGWKITSSSRNLARSAPFVALIGRKLYVLGGEDRGEQPRDTKNYWGEIYDLDSKKWKVLEMDIKSTFGDFDYSDCVVVEKEGEPTRIVFFPWYTSRCRLLFYNVSTGEFLIEDHPSLDLEEDTHRHACLREGLEACEYENIHALKRVCREVRAVVNNSILYWFTCDLYLYGYDLVEKRWFQSKCLKRELWTIPTNSWWYECENPSPSPILVDLCNGKFLLIVPSGSYSGQGESALAILDVVKEKNSLNVSIESLHTLLVDDPCFLPDDGMVMKV